MTDELCEIKCPALVVVGDEDILKPYKFSKILADNIPNSEFAVIPGSGHVTIFEKPNILNTCSLDLSLRIVNFLNRQNGIIWCS